MPIANSTMAEFIQAGVGKPAVGEELVGFGGVFTATCFDSEGRLKWEEKFHNIVVSVGLNYLNTQFFQTSTAYTPAWYLGLVDGGGSVTYSASDTLASHGATGSGGWSEFTNYSGSRKLVAWNNGGTNATPSVITNSSSPSIYTISGAGGTVAGAFLCTVATGTSGTLFSEGSFSSNKVVANGDTVNVTYTFNANTA